jgi:hypothetical protein
LKQKLFFVALALIVALSACGLPVASTPVPSGPDTSVATNTPLPPSVPALTLDALRNFTYHAPFYDKTITLTNGEYVFDNGIDKYRVGLLDVNGIGDLNGDNVPDTAVIIYENGGGSGNFESLIILYNENGTPVQAGEVQLGDRVLVKSVTIQNGEIVLDMQVHGPNDGLCCPSVPTVQTYRMIDGYMWMTRLISKLTDGTERSITVTAPANGVEVTSPFDVTGAFTIAPFENNLACRVYLPDGTKLFEAGFLVDSGGVMGGPGIFSQELNLDYTSITGTVIIQYLDLSAADGSTLALGSVVVSVK